VNYFQLFDLPVGFAIDLNDLAKRYRALQSAVHPDRFANASAADKRAAMERTVLINDAYKSLKDSVQRAMYLLSLGGINGLDEKNTQMPADFLMEQMEKREAIEAANDDGAALDAMVSELRAADRNLGQQFAAQYGSNLMLATVTARKMRFNQKLLEEIDSRLAALDC
jgi:molecular chaperone HscB